MNQPSNSPQLKRRLIIQFIIICILFSAISFSAYRVLNRQDRFPPGYVDEFIDYRIIQEIPLTGDISKAKAEISGMAWYSDTLILLPQYPYHLGKGGSGVVYALKKADILGYLDGKTSAPLSPTAIPINSKQFSKTVHGFEGFEGVTFHDNRAYITIEASSPMKGYLASGTLDPGLKFLNMDAKVVEIPLPAEIENYADEALLIFQDKIYTFYEANGINVSPDPVAHIFDLELESLGTISMPNIEYRLTDADTPDQEGKFWVVNTLYLGDLIKLKPGPDLIAGESNQNVLLRQPLERLVELKITKDGIEPGVEKAIRIALAKTALTRNWEALAVLDERGFLIATDTYPDTILAFISRQ